MNKKRLKQVALSTIIVFIFFISLECRGSDSTNMMKRNIAFVCFGGKETFGSVGFEHIFRFAKKLNWSYSIGVQPFEPSRKFSVPVSINAFTRGALHHFEVDLMATFYMDKYHRYDGGRQDNFNKQLYLSPFVGYRLQGSHWFMLKAGIGPQVVLDPPANDIWAFRTRVIPLSGFGMIGVCF